MLSLHQEMQLHTAHKTKTEMRKEQSNIDDMYEQEVMQDYKQQMQLFLPAEETWHSVPSKAGDRTLLSLQLM